MAVSLAIFVGNFVEAVIENLVGDSIGNFVEDIVGFLAGSPLLSDGRGVRGEGKSFLLFHRHPRVKKP
jgi:hypothetical protein